MHKSIYLLICFLFLILTGNLNAQELDEVLKQVEQNNPKLKAIVAWNEGQKWADKAENSFPAPEAMGYLLNSDNSNRETYTEFQISQSFEFPTAYSSRTKLNQQRASIRGLEYQKERQDILLETKEAYIQLVYLSKKITLENKRLKDAQKVYQQIQTLYDKGDASILHLNKGKIVWLQYSFSVDQLNIEKEQALLVLKALNGGQSVQVTSVSYPDGIELAPLDDVWNSKLNSDPQLIQLLKEEELANQQVKLEKSKSLPGLSLGYNQQGVKNERFSGLYGAITIPMWKARNEVKKARANQSFQQLQSDWKRQYHKAELEKQYTGYVLQLDKFKAYTSTLEQLNDESLLTQAYEAGELSFISFYNEQKFYREAWDKMLLMERELHLVKTQLLKHQL